MEKQSEVNRNCGIEMLKIISIFLIIISHVVMTIRLKNQFVSYDDYIFDFSYVSKGMSGIILAIFQHFGSLGNTIFFVCSSWFLLEKDTVSKNKWIKMFLEIWTISCAILLIMLIYTGGRINNKLIIKSLLPNFFTNNWYVTAYLIFYPLHTVLNRIIKDLNQKNLLKITTVLFLLYCVCNSLYDSFFSSVIIMWITLYFFIAYIKIYMIELCNNIKVNSIVLIIGISIIVFLIVFTYIAGENNKFFSNKMLFWNKNCNPIFWVIAVTSFNIFRKINIKSSFINNISKYSLLIYIIHENILLRNYIRPYILHLIYNILGYKYIIVWVVLLSIVIFAFSLLIGIIYRVLFGKIIEKLAGKMIVLIDEIYKKYEKTMYKIK